MIQIAFVNLLENKISVASLCRDQVCQFVFYLNKNQLKMVNIQHLYIKVGMTITIYDFFWDCPNKNVFNCRPKMLSQSQLSILSQSLMTIDFELRSDKQTVRDKALGKIQHILVHRTDEVTELLANQNVNSDITWSRLFETAHESIVDAAGQLAATEDAKKLTTLKGKIGDKINVMQRIVSLSCQDRVIRISFKSILQKVFQCFRHRAMVQYFGDCYLQIVTKHVLNAKADLSEIKQEEWSGK